MTKLDRRTIDEIGVSGAVLMENAGRGTVEQMLRYFPSIKNGTVGVFCGKGNNGGDGFVIARYFLNQGAGVKVFLLSAADQVQGDAGINLGVFRKMGGRIYEITDEAVFQNVKEEAAAADILVDALLGTGLSSEVTGLYRTMIQFLNGFDRGPVVSVDIPSGIDATTGKVLGCGVKAALTCTYGLPKIGHFTYPGREHTGSLEVIDIGIPQILIDQADIRTFVQEANDFTGMLPQRKPDSHKGTYGHALILAGSPGKTGAAAMAGHAAMKAGGGLVTLAVPAGLRPVVEGKTREVMTEGLKDSANGCFCLDAWPELRVLLNGKSVVAAGPGLSDRDETGHLLSVLMEEADMPLVLDADALNLVSKNTEILKKVRKIPVLTPHPGEMARLTGMSVGAVQENRLKTASDFARACQAVVVLKGASTVIAGPDGRGYINPTGNPGMAGGGMGDVLTGLITGLISQGVKSLDAARMAVYVHGAIGDRIARENAEIGILATDISERIPEFLRPFVQQNGSFCDDLNGGCGARTGEIMTDKRS